MTNRLLKSLRDVTRFITTTKVPVMVLNEIVKDLEEAIDKGHGRVTVYVRNGKICKQELSLDKYYEECNEDTP
jgi:hypothetical protein